jgi:hypothetical protein
MKPARLLLIAALTLLGTTAFAQSDAQKTAAPPALSDAAKSFEKMKTLAGSWQGPVTTDMKMDHDTSDKPIRVTLRITSRGNAMVHEMKEAGSPDDPTKYDNPITMLYVDGDRLYLTHYCDAGNRPRMAGKISPDGKTIEFDFVDVSGSTEQGHMSHAVFTFLDANHHTEDWVYLMPGDRAVHGHMDLQRAN